MQPNFHSLLPQQLIQSLQGVKGFDKDAFEQVHASGDQVTSIRFNPPKWKKVTDSSIAQEKELFKQAEDIPWCKFGKYLNERPLFTIDPLFHAGVYYVQEASSMFVWHVLEQTIGNSTSQKVLDLCAAPGGKSTLLASYFTDGLVVSNEVIKSRANILVDNIAKWGSDNVVVTNNDPSHFKSLPSFFDVMVIDAPCSGSGLFRKDPNAINEWSEDNVNLCSKRQQRILADVFPALKEGGTIIYSTCSYSTKEDEEILDWIMAEFDVENIRIPIDETWGIVESQSDRTAAFGYRFYPYLAKGEGFFIAAFKKKGTPSDIRYKEQSLTTVSKNEKLLLHNFISIPEQYQLFKQGEGVKMFPSNWFKELEILSKHLYIKKAGIELGSIKGKDIIPHHELALSLQDLENIPKVELEIDDALEYLRKKELKIEALKGWNLVTFCELPMGWIKVLPNRINNYYPAELRILKY